MALNLGTLCATLKLDDAEFQKKLRDAPGDAKAAGKKVGDGVADGINPGMAKVSSAFAKIGAGALLGLGAASVLAIGAVRDFAELQDATAAAGVTFGDAMDQIQTKADDAAGSLGISKQQYIDAALTMGTFGKSAGLAGDDLATFGNQMVAVAGDMASFRGTTPEEAIEAVGAALRGEMEPIRKYGVMLDDASLRQQALAMGLIKTTKEGLTPQVKVLAAQAAILEKTKDAQGDFARTSDSTANVQKQLAAQSANLSAQIGEKLAPALVAAQKAGIGVLEWTSDNQAALVPLVGTVAAAAAAFGGFLLVAKGIEAAKSARDTVKGVGDAFQAMSTKAKVATVSAGGVGLAVAALAGAYGLFAEKQADSQRAVEDYTQALKEDNGALADNVRAKIAQRLEDAHALEAARTLGISVADVTDAILNGGDAMLKVQDIMAARSDEMGEQTAESVRLGEAARLLTGVLGGENTELQKSVESYKRVSDAAQPTATGIDKVTGAADDGTISMKDYADAIDAVYRAQLSLRGDRRGLQAAIDAATASVKENGKTLNEHTPKGRANAEALDAIARAGLAVVTSLQKTNAPAGKVAGAMDESRTAFVKAATAMGLSKTAAGKLATSLGLIKSKKVKVEANVVKTGVTYIKLAKGAGRVDLDVGYGGGRAKGGPVRRGIPYLVGELGPELVTFGQDGNVHNHRDTQRMMAGGSAAGGASGGSTINIVVQVPVNADVVATGRAIEQVLGKYQVLSGKNRLAFSASMPGQQW